MMTPFEGMFALNALPKRLSGEAVYLPPKRRGEGRYKSMFEEKPSGSEMDQGQFGLKHQKKETRDRSCT